MKGTAMRKYAAVIGILAGVAAIGMGLYIHSAQPKLGPSWHVIGILVTSPRLLLGVGVVMIVGGVLTLWNPAVGGVIVLAGAVLGLVYCYTHEWTRFALLKVWAPAVILAWIAGILAGYALAQSVKAYDEPPVYDEEPPPPSTDSPSASA